MWMHCPFWRLLFSKQFKSCVHSPDNPFWSRPHAHMKELTAGIVGVRSAICEILPFMPQSLQEFSMTGWRYLNVTQVSDYPCIIRATNRQETWTSEHKLKISSMMLSIKGEVDHPREGRSNGLSSTDILKSAMSGLRSSEFVLDAENT